MLRALELAGREFYHRVTEVADRVAGEGSHVLPLTEVVGRFGLHLEAAEPVEEDGNGAEVCVGHEANVIGVGGVGGSLR